MDKIEQAKKILKKAIALDDAELMAIANEMLGLDDDTSWEPLATPAPVEEKPAPPSAPERKIEVREADFDSFKMNNSEDLRSKNGVAVNKIQREIQFVDDGSDRDIVTPETTRAERKRKVFKMIEQKCEKCGRTVETHPQHKREFFVCDGCIRK